jgi:hypothetical protein
MKQKTLELKAKKLCNKLGIVDRGDPQSVEYKLFAIELILKEFKSLLKKK